MFQTAKLNKIMYLIDKIEGMKIKRNYGIPVTGSYLKTAITAINKTSKSTIGWIRMKTDFLRYAALPRISTTFSGVEFGTEM